MVKIIFSFLIILFLTSCFTNTDIQKSKDAWNHTKYFFGNSLRSDKSLIKKYCSKYDWNKNNVICFDRLPQDERLCKFSIDDFIPPNEYGDEMFWISNYKKYIKFTKHDVIKKLNEMKLTPEICIEKTCYPSLNSSIKNRWDVKTFVNECQKKKKAQKDYINYQRKQLQKKDELAKKENLEQDLQNNRIQKCKNFGFKVGSQQMAKCTFDLYKLEMQDSQTNNIINKIESKKDAQRLILKKQLKEQQFRNDMLLLQKNLDYFNSLNNSSGFIK